MAARRIPAQPRFVDPTMNRFAEQTIAALKAQADAGNAVLAYGSPVALAYGGAGFDGVSTDVARADHVHALPALPGGGGTVLDARGTPTGLNATLSDDFAADTSANYALWDEGGGLGSLLVDTTRRSLRVTMAAGAAAQRAVAAYVAVPATATFTVAAWVNPYNYTIAANSFSYFLAVGQDFSAAGSDYLACSYLAPRTGTQGVSVNTLSGLSGIVAPTVTNARNLGGETGLWLRARVTVVAGPNTTLELDVCSDLADARGFIHIGSVTAAFTPLHLGFGMHNHNSAAAATAEFSNVRVWDGVAGMNDTLNGGFV